MAERYPVGTGWWVGSVTRAAIGLFVGAVTGEVTLGLIAFVATGTPIGLAVEQQLDTRPLRPTERRLLLGLFALGVVGFLIVFAVPLAACGPGGRMALPRRR